MAVHNPFRPTRFEHQNHALIWVSPNVKTLEGLKSVFLAGARGSGKTSLLKAVEWRERLSNQSLIDQYRGVEPDYVAVYFRLPDFVSKTLALVNWKRLFPDAPDHDVLEYEFFASVIEMIAAQLICEAISNLRAVGRFEYPADAEANVVQGIVQDYPFLQAAGANITGLDQLASILHAHHRRLSMSATRGILTSADATLMSEQPSIFINDFVGRLRALACETGNVCSQQFHMKICIDDCETLTDKQQQYLNSLVRESRNPLFWVISYVSGDYNATATMLPNQHLSEADRNHIDLDVETEVRFKKFCESVTALRILYSSSELQVKRTTGRGLPEFSLDKLLGTASINDLLIQTMKNTVSPAWDELVERSRDVEKWYKIPGRDAPPIYETYVLEKLQPRISPEARAGNLRGLEPYMRRKQRAALLLICNEFKISNIPYAGSSVVISLSDLCIRDYLEIMAEIFDRAVAAGQVSTLEALVDTRKRLTIPVQRVAIYDASSAKFNGIKTTMERDWVEAMKAVECLGRLCARVQADPHSRAALATPERGIFLFDLEEATGRDADAQAARRETIHRILKRCEADGYLRHQSASRAEAGDQVSTYSYRLHRRFAPYFGFSFRGPYEAIRLPIDDFAEICERPGEVVTETWVRKVYSKITEDAGQDALPM